MELAKLLTASSSILLPLIFLVIFQMSAKKGMTISLIFVILLSFIVWGMGAMSILSATIIGTIKAISIIWILFGAIFLLNILRASGALDIMIAGFKNLTGDKRIQIIIIGFYFVALLEGASGFGAPAAIAAPLLIILGFDPIAAASLALIGNAVPMTFGAVGTPLVDGMAQAIKADVNIAELIRNVAIKTAFTDLFIGTLIPVLQVVLLTTIFSKEKSLKKTLEIIPFALLSGIIYTSLAFTAVIFLGPEFGALIGAFIGLIIVMFLVKYKVLLPKVNNNEETIKITKKQLIKAWFPYLLMIILLIISRVVKPVKLILLNLSLQFNNIFNTPFSTKFDLFYSPGFVLTLTAIIVMLIFKLNKTDVKWSLSSTLLSVRKTAFALIPALAMVYIFLYSNHNNLGYIGMTEYLANSLSNLFGSKWLFAAPFLGNLGTFISGSSTTSNIMFSQIQYQVAVSNNFNPLYVLTAQAIGANTGCMISVSKVVSACAVVGLTGKESKVMRITLVVSLLYALFVGILLNILM